MPKTMDTNTTYANRKAGTSNQASRGVTSAPARRGLTFVLATLAFLSFAAFATPAQADTINVSGNASLAAALSAANPGDVIILADGTYAGFTMSRSGTADAHILIKAANMGGANIASGVIHLSQTSYVTLAGLTITTGGASQTVDGEWLRFAVWFDATQHCRLTRSVLKLAVQPKNLQWVLLGGASDSNRIDHNEFGPGTSPSGAHYVWPRGRRTIDGVTPPADRTSWANGLGPVNPNMVRNTRIDHNYFHDKALGSGEAIVLGGLGVTGDYQDTFSTIEYNVFQNCDGDAEIISVKSSSNALRYNTILTSNGTLSLRAGNRSSVYSNFMLQGGKSGAGGIKLYEMDHKVYNNYIEATNDYPILVGGGDDYTSPTFSHAQVFRALILHNTVVNPGRQVRIGHGAPLPPVDSTFANNLITGPGTLYTENLVPINFTRSHNITWPFDSGKTGFTVVDPQLATVDGLQKLTPSSPAVNNGDPSYLAIVTDDMDGQPRDAAPDIGADELSSEPVLRRPLTPADVGPNSAPDIAAPTFDPPPSTYTSPQLVTIASTTPGTSIRYTTDGTMPTATTGILYTGPVLADWGTTTLQAIAFASGLLDSTVTSATYTVNDVTPPVITVPGDITVEAAGSDGAVATFAASATDNKDGTDPVTLTPLSGSTFPLGTTVVMAIATDAAGNTATATFNVTVVDTTPPLLTLPSDLLLEATSPAGAVATFTASAHDLVSGDVPVSFSITSGSTFPLGTTVVTASAVDAAGNTATGTFKVTVRDSTPPTLTLPSDAMLEATRPAGAVATFTASAHDIVSGDVPVTFSIASGSTFPLGTTVVTASAVDAAGNTATGTFKITVRDTTPPTLLLPVDLVLEATSPAGAVATFTADAHDIVSGDLPVSFSIASGSVFPLGTTVVTASAVDGTGNTATGTFKITVRDTTAPQIVKLTASPSSLWPPNHRLVPVVLTAMVTDAADPAPKTHIISVSSNEPADEDEDERERTRGDHDRDDRPPGPDWIITGDLTLKLRAEHGNRHSRRIYIITVKSRDAAGNASTKTVTLAVQPREDRDDE